MCERLGEEGAVTEREENSVSDALGAREMHWGVRGRWLQVLGEGKERGV